MTAIGPETPGVDRPPVRDGIVEAIGPLSGRNAIAAAFYEGPGWVRFRPWERFFLRSVGGARRARGQIIRHLGRPGPGARLLEVGIGDGENLPHLAPDGWEVHGVDLARRGLVACLGRDPGLAGRLAWAEAEALPHEDGSFDACLCVGGFNYFGDHPKALAEARRVTRPGGPVVIADERPDLIRLGLGHLLGLPRLDAWWLRRIGLDPAFVDMAMNPVVDLDALLGGWPGARRVSIWRGLGYALVGPGGLGDDPFTSV